MQEFSLANTKITSIGSMTYEGAPPSETTAELVIINDNILGMLFSVRHDIMKVLRCNSPEPIDRLRAKQHLEELVEYGYVKAYKMALESRFDEPIDEDWFVSVGYLNTPNGKRRAYIVHENMDSLSGGDIVGLLRATHAVGPLRQPWDLEMNRN